MADHLRSIEAAFVELAAALPEVGAALDHVPESLPAADPAAWVCLLFHGYARDDEHQTGPATQVEWEWEVQSYVRITVGGGGGYRGAQEALKSLVPALMAAVRANRDLLGTCDRARLVDVGDPPSPDAAEGYLLKPLRLRAVVEEV